MTWVVEKLTEIVVEALMAILKVFGTTLMGQLSLNGLQTLNRFKQVFPTVTQAYSVFLYMAFGIIFLAMVYQLFKCFFGPMTDKTETPFKIIVSSLFSCVLVACSQIICAAIFEITTIPYKAINSITDANNLETFLARAPATSPGYVIATEILSATIIYWIILVVLYFMMLKQFIMLTLEIVERYVLIGMFTIVAPLCLACGCVAPLRNIQQSWIQVMINSCIVMVFSTFFITIFTTSFAASSDIISILMYIAWLKTGQKVDEHMNTLGLKTARSGGFGMDVMSALAHGVPAATAMANKIHGTNLPTRAGGGGGSNGGGPSRGILGGLGHMAGAANINRGEQSTRKGLMGMVGRSKAGKQLADAANSKIGNAKGALANSKLGQKFGLDEKVGTLSGMTSEELKAQREGQIGMPSKNDFAQSYQNAIHDQAEAVMGKDKVKEMEDAGYKLQDMSIGQDGKCAFNFTDDNGNEVIANCTPGGDTNGNFSFTDANGDTYSTQFAANVKDEDNPPDLAPFTGAVDSADDNMRPAEAMEGDLNKGAELTESGDLNGTSTMSVEGEEGSPGVELASGVVNDDMSINTCNADGVPTDGGDHVMAMVDGQEQAVPLESIGAEEKQMANSADGSGPVALAKETANERFTEDGTAKASDFNNVTDSSGASRQYDQSAGFERGEDNKTYATDAATKEKFQVSEGSVDASGGVSVNDGNGNTKNSNDFQYARSEEGRMQKVEGNTYSQVRTDRSITEGDKCKIGNSYYDKNSEIAKEAMGQQNYTVALAGGGYAISNNGLRYDEFGNVSAKGEYMQIKGADNSVSLQKVRTENGNVPVYDRKPSMVSLQVRDGNSYRDIGAKETYSRDFTPVTSQNYNAGSAVYRQDGNTVERYAQDGFNGTTRQPVTFVQTKDNQYIALDDKNSVGGKYYSANGAEISKDNLIMSKSAGHEGTPATYQKVISGDTGVATYRSNDRSASRVVQCSENTSYHGIPTSMDLSRCTVASEYDGPYKTGRIQVTDTQTGTTYMATPMNGPYKVSDEGAGAYVNFGGKQYFFEKTSNDTYNTGIRSMGVNPTYNGDTSIDFRKHADTLRYNMGINTNQMTSMTAHTTKTGESHCIATYKNGDRMEIVPRIPNNATDAQKRSYKPLVANRMKNGKVVQEVVGYQRKLRANDTSFNVGSNKRASTKNTGFFMKRKK